jgi:hypothetical protein
MPSGPLFGVLVMRALAASRTARVRDSRGHASAARARPRRVRRVLLATMLIALLAVSLTGVAQASGGWAPSFDLSAVSGGAEGQQVAADPSGGAIAVWSAYGGASDGVQARHVGASGALGPLLDVTEAGERGESPQVAVDAAGNATVVWLDSGTPDGQVHSRRLTPAGALGDIQELSPAGQSAGDPGVVVDASGTATAVWAAFDGVTDVVYARRINVAGEVGPVLAVSGPGESASRQRVAVDPDGNAVIAWQDVNGPESRIRARVLDATGGLRAIVTLSAAGLSSFGPDVAVDPSGVPTAAWLRSDGTIQARQGTPGGGLGPIEDLSRPDVHGSPALAVDRSGQATVVWGGFDGVNEIIGLRRLGPVGQIATLSAGGDDSEPQIAVDAQGDATVVWLHRSDAGHAVQSRTVTAEGDLGATVDLTPASEELVTPRLATDPAGNSTAVWSRYDGSRYVIAGARSVVPAPQPPPPLPPAPAPAPAPESPAPPAPAAAVAPDCLPVSVKGLRAHTAGQPKSQRKRTKGVGVRLKLDRRARLRLLAATLSYTRRGAARTVKLRTVRLTTVGERGTLRFRLPRRLTPKLQLGRRVKVKLRLRAKPTDAGCAFGRPKTLTVRTKLIWVAR